MAYAIGCAVPVSVFVETFGTSDLDRAQLEELVRRHFELTPAGIIRTLDLLKPGYRATAALGHFGREGERFTWEKTDKAEALARDAAQLLETAS